MPFSYTCPFCGKETWVDDAYAGQSGPCIGCGQIITMPGTANLNAAGPGPAPVMRQPVPSKGMGTGAILAICFGSFFLVLIPIIGILVALLLPAVQAAREAARRMQCSNNLKQIELALHNYADVYGQLPPAYTTDETGKPLHSWRTLLLPYLEEQVVYDQLKLDEPWDSPANREVFENTNVVFYSCASSPDSMMNNNTSYAMVVGPGCVSDGPTGCRFRDLVNGSSNTIHIVETTAPIPWYEPRDILFETVQQGDAALGDEPTIGSFHPGGFNATMCDGSVQYISDDISRPTLEALLQGKVKQSPETLDFD